jgi:hypothetical protein
LQDIANKSIDWMFAKNQKPLKSQGSIAPIPTIKPLLLPATKKSTPIPQSPALPVTPLTSGYTNVVSSFYTPGEGGAINGGKTDIRGKYIDRNSFVMATRTTGSNTVRLTKKWKISERDNTVFSL